MIIPPSFVLLLCVFIILFFLLFLYTETTALENIPWKSIVKHILLFAPILALSLLWFI
jgi:hypothetical protein